MRVRVAVGDVEIELDGLDLSKADVTRLLKRASMIAAALTHIAADTPNETEPSETKDLDAQVTLSSDDTPLFGFTRWLPEDPEWVPEEAP